MTGAKKMREQEKAFADYYLETGNAEQSAIRAGYSKRYARGNAHKLVARRCIREYLDARIAAKEEKRIAKQDEVLQFLTSVMRGEPTEQIPLGLGYGEQMLVDKTMDGRERVKAAELLGKRYALFTEKQQLDANIGVQIVDDVGGEDPDGYDDGAIQTEGDVENE